VFYLSLYAENLENAKVPFNLLIWKFDDLEIQKITFQYFTFKDYAIITYYSLDPEI